MSFNRFFTKATQDSSSQTITSTYIKSLSVSGRTITYTKGDITTGSISTQDTNTTYSVGTSTYSGTTKLYTTTGSNTDGTMTQKAIKEAVDGVNGKVYSTYTDVTGEGTNYFYIKRKSNYILYALINATDASTPVTSIGTDEKSTDLYTIRTLGTLATGKIYRFYILWISFINS